MVLKLVMQCGDVESLDSFYSKKNISLKFFLLPNNKLMPNKNLIMSLTQKSETTFNELKS